MEVGTKPMPAEPSDIFTAAKSSLRMAYLKLRQKLHQGLPVQPQESWQRSLIRLLIFECSPMAQFYAAFHLSSRFESLARQETGMQLMPADPRGISTEVSLNSDWRSKNSSEYSNLTLKLRRFYKFNRQPLPSRK
jgi:hypothetical protein